jgi:hypothetical protein
LAISQQLNREFPELKFKSLSLHIMERYDNYVGRTVRKTRREYDYAGRIVIKKKRDDNCVGRSGKDDLGGREV